MNVSRIIDNLKRVNAELEKIKHYPKHPNRPILQKGKRKWQKMLNDLISPTAPAKQLPKQLPLC